MHDFFNGQLPHLTTDQLVALVQDCESRIGSHIAGGSPVEAYVEKQKSIISMVQDEFSKRGLA